MRFLVILFTLAALTVRLDAQIERTITVQVVDMVSKEPLAFALAYNLRSQASTSSDAQGTLQLPFCQVGDTVIVSYIGYEDYSLIVSQQLTYRIELSARQNILSEVVITANDDYLYSLISAVKKGRRTPTIESKTYFYLKSEVNDTTTEIIESYYNGTYANHGVEQIELKKGRIGLRPLDQRYYINTESSRLFAMYNLYNHSARMPDNPLSIRRSSLRKNYWLTHVKSFSQDDGEIIVIDFIPKSSAADLFSGRLWINQSSARLVKADLNISNALIYPFIQVAGYDLRNVNIQITQTFDQVDSEQYVKETSFNYSYNYTSRFDKEVYTSTSAILHSYDFRQKFVLPYFAYEEHAYRDYKDIMAIPYDSVFWDVLAEYRLYDKVPMIDSFMTSYMLRNLAQGINSSHRDGPMDWFQHSYVLWDEERFTMSEASSEIIGTSQKRHPFDKDRYHLECNLYLDVTPLDTGFSYQLYTTIIPRLSYYHFYMSEIDQVFINMYFDLLEIQRRHLDSKLKALRIYDKEIIENLYRQSKLNHLKTADQYIADTDRGRNMVGLRKWNKYILDQLAVDNLRLYRELTSDE